MEAAVGSVLGQVGRLLTILGSLEVEQVVVDWLGPEGLGLGPQCLGPEVHWKDLLEAGLLDLLVVGHAGGIETGHLHLLFLDGKIWRS